MLPEPENEVKTAEMVHGDMLVMMSDGVLMGLGQMMTGMKKDGRVFEILSGGESAGTGQCHFESCDGSLHYEAEDDMTVLVCGLYRKPKL